MIDILIIVGSLLVTAVVAWCGGAKYERKKNNKRVYTENLRKYLSGTSIPRKWE